MGVAAGRIRGISEAWTKEWALKSLLAARTDQYAVEDECGGVGGRLRTGGCSNGHVCVPKPTRDFLSGYVPLSPDFIPLTGIQIGKWSMGGSKFNFAFSAQGS